MSNDLPTVDQGDLLAERSLATAWTNRWREDPRRRVLRDRSGEWLSAGDLERLTADGARRLRAAMEDRQSTEGGSARVLVSGGTSVAYVVAYVSAIRAGCTVVPVNRSYTPREVGAVVEASRPTVAIVESPVTRAHLLASADADGLLCVGLDLDDLPPAPESTRGEAGDLPEIGPDDPALLPFTSGTTGKPKGVLLTHGNLLASAEGLRRAWRWTPEDRLVLCLPLFHMHGLGVGVHGTLVTGASAILHDGFDAEAVLEEASTPDPTDSRLPTMFFGVPTMYARFAQAERPERLQGLRLCVSGSAPLSAELHGEIAQRCGQVVLERYGMTETAMLTSNPFDGERRAGTVGHPLPGVELRLSTDESGESGDRGEIEVRGPNVFAGYLDRPEANAEAFTVDGWFRTGDVGQIDADGYVAIVGRAKELIISGGYNVFPREIEDVLRSHPAVADAAVVGTPSAEWGEVVTAYLELSDEVAYDEGDLRRRIEEELAPYKRPRLFHVVEALPRNGMGKVVRGDLRPPAAQP